MCFILLIRIFNVVFTIYIVSPLPYFQTAVLLWMHDPAGRDAVILRQTLVVDKNLEAATEVICSRTPSQLQYLKQVYHSKFGVFLEHDIQRNTSGDHEKVKFLFALVCMCAWLLGKLP